MVAIGRQLGKLIEDQGLAILVGIQHRGRLANPSPSWD